MRFACDRCLEVAGGTGGRRTNPTATLYARVHLWYAARVSILGDQIRATLTDEMWQRRREWLDDDALWFDPERVQHREDTIALCLAVAEIADAHPEETTVYGMAMRGLIRRDVCNTVEMQLVACQPWLAPSVKRNRSSQRRPSSRP